MTSKEVRQLFEQTGALLKGHFVLRSGRHSREYFQCALALQEMPTVERFGRALANQVRDLAATTVVAPAMGGLVIGQEIARQLGLRFVFVEKENEMLVLSRGFRLCADERVLITDDVITTGGSVQETTNIVEQASATPVGIAAIVDRSGGQVKFKYPLKTLLQLNVETFPPDDLPPDLRDTPAVKPGS
ncbi:MAG: Orotate phosphoribosyltransferase [Verrucomicrobia subdivision 3 bacterium]|nr:Orotate phosphoribosyltransferase [Limisphaerales bacterium]MCS1414655.1 Orotate phosphoribosyltransferase [Limisphaerales bacterium]